jgi:hypothetical protein
VTLPMDQPRPARRRLQEIEKIRVLSGSNPKARTNLGNSLPSYYVAGDGVSAGSRSLRDRTGRVAWGDGRSSIVTKSNYYDSVSEQQIFRYSYGVGGREPARAGHEPVRRRAEARQRGEWPGPSDDLGTRRFAAMIPWWRPAAVRKLRASGRPLDILIAVAAHFKVPSAKGRCGGK